MLDSWAVLAYLGDEQTGQEVADIIASAQDQGTVLTMSIVSDPTGVRAPLEIGRVAVPHAPQSGRPARRHAIAGFATLYTTGAWCVATSLFEWR